MSRIDDLKQEQQLIEQSIRLQAQYASEGREIDKDFVKSTVDRIKAQEEELKLLKSKAGYNEEEAKAIERSIKKSKELLSVYKETGTATGMIVNNLSSVGTGIKEFLTNTSKQYALAEKMAQVYKGLGRDLGMTGKSAKFLEKSFKGALPTAIELGFNANDLASVYEDISEKTGRVSNLTSKDAETITSIAASMNLSTSDAAEMSETFMLMGLSTEQIEKNMIETYKSAQSMGLNARKVIKVLQQNVDKMQGYSFANGVKGMTEMAKLGVKLRMDVSEMLQMADQFYQPEAAIEAAANLQMLGGDIAQAFGDPFETMYLARNKPEELAKKVGKMTENMMQFNEESGEFEITAESRMQLQETSKQLGLSYDNMVKMSRQSAKISKIKTEFVSVGDDEMKESLASMAKFKDGKFVIETEEFGDLGLDEVTDDMAKAIMQENQSEEENLKDIALNTQTMSQQMERFKESTEAKIATATNIYEIFEEQFKPQFDKVKEGVEKTVKPYIDGAKDFFDQEIGDGESKILDDMFNGLSDLSKKIKDGVSPALDAFSTKLIATADDIGKGLYTVTPHDANDMVSMPGSNGRVLTGEFGALSLNDKDLVMAGDPNKLTGGGNNSGTPSRMEFGNLNISGKIEIVSPDGSANGMDMSSLKPQIEKMIISHMNGSFRDGGVTSSKQATDYMGQS
jgi:hypothetical protein